MNVTPVKLRPFFCFYGGKYRIAPHYPRPEYGRITEPFAGGAGYSTRYHDCNVTLCDADPVIYGIWKYLTRVKLREVELLPARVEHVDDVKGPQEAKWLIGFWLKKGQKEPGYKGSTWMKSGSGLFWGEFARDRIAYQVQSIRHWKVIHGDYATAPDVESTWFIDPPYSGPVGRHYVKQVGDYQHLAEWCKSRKGLAIVCENPAATWLPFSFFRKAKSSGNGKEKTCEEGVYIQRCHSREWGSSLPAHTPDTVLPPDLLNGD